MFDYDPRNFRIEHVKGNIGLLLGFHSGNYLYASKEGKIIEIEPTRRWIFKIKNFLKFNADRDRLRQVIECSFFAFFYEIRMPRERNKMFFILNKKKTIAHKIIKNLPDLEKKLTFIASRADRRVYLQAQIVHNAYVATQKAKKDKAVKEVKNALFQGILPVLAISGSSGAYFMRGLQYQILGVFKPFDEEAYAPNNPRSFEFRGVFGINAVRYGIRVGECLHREVAASLVDQFCELNCVPKTVYAMFSISSFPLLKRLFMWTDDKRGSFQYYVNHASTLGRLGEEFVMNMEANLLQPMFALDIIIGHLDRHLSNLLWNGEKVFAIDNALSFPAHNEDFTRLEWAALPQAKIPFSLEMHAKIEKIDSASLKEYLIRKSRLSYESANRLYERVELLKEAIKVNLCPSEIVGLMKKENLERLKDREKILKPLIKECLKS